MSVSGWTTCSLPRWRSVTGPTRAPVPSSAATYRPVPSRCPVVRNGSSTAGSSRGGPEAPPRARRLHAVKLRKRAVQGRGSGVSRHHRPAILQANRRPSRGQGSDRSMSTGIVGENKKSLMLFSGRAFPELAEEIGEFLGTAATPTDAYDFANGEIFIRYKESV